MKNTAEPIIFFEEKHSTSIEDVKREGDCPLSIPYLKKGDSNIYLGQFLVKEEDISELVAVKVEEAKDESSSSRRCD